MAETDTATVTPLRPKTKTKAKDVTNATRQRRHRTKRKTASPALENSAPEKIKRFQRYSNGFAVCDRARYGTCYDRN